MANAWLDSLSEDWVSQAGSEPSHSPTHSTKLNSKTNTTTPTSRGSSGRLFGSVRHPPSHGQDHSPGNSSNVLSERSANDINIFGSTRRNPSPSKLSNEYKIQDVKELQSRANGQNNNRQTRRSVSASSLGSVIHNTVDHRPQSMSPGKGGETPEWRRRLVQGDLAYGEQRDLFTSAKVGLENMFNPPESTTPEDLSEDEGGNHYEPHNYNHNQPPPPPPDVEDEEDEQFSEEPRIAHDMTMPSSPPVHAVQYDSSANYDESAAPQLPEQPRGHSLDPVPEESAAFEEEHDNGIEEGQDEDDEEDGSVRRHFQDSQNGAEEGSMPPSDDNGSQIRYPIDRESRVVSGQSELRNESFSAIMISPVKNKDGDGVVFAPVTDLPSGELKRRLENLRWNQMVLADDADQAGPNNAGSRVVSIGGKSLNVDNTEEYDKMGGFINFRRGGRSADGSFRDRMLSPPIIGNDTSEMLPEESLQASTPKQFASVRIEIDTVDSRRTPQVPRVPNPSPEKRGSLSRQQQQQPGGGSPLKLFGPYDTFTNQTLMRRISQFEDQMSNGSRNSADRSANLSMSPDGRSRSEMAQAFVAGFQKTESRQSSAQFGAGELDGYRFGDDNDNDNDNDEDVSQSQQPHEPSQFVDDGALGRDEASLSPQPLSSNPFSAVPADKKQGELHIQRMRQSRGAMSSRPTTAEKWTEPVDSAASVGAKIPVLATPRRIAEIGSEGKRPRTSPSKDPTPKRRRTLHKSDVAFGVEAAQGSAAQSPFDSVQASHANMQSVIGRKRRDARDGDEFQYADAETLANRDILRPRTPTPSQRSSVLREQNPNLSGVDDYPQEFDQTYDQTYDQTNNSNFKLRENVPRDSSAAWSDNSVSGPHAPAEGGPSLLADGGERKPSIRTEDFMNEAHKIMDMLRNRGGVGAGLASVEESELETPLATPSGDVDSRGDGEEEEVSFQESTKEPFSRPPSREGRPVPRAARMQEDPELVARLKKYEERSDLDDIVTTTTRSISLAQNAIRAEKEAAQAVAESIALRSRTRLDESDDISDPPNMRITTNPKNVDRGEHDENPSHKSTSSQSTVSSIPTGSSRGSDTRKTIAPQTVSHLIPDQVGNMMLDRDRNIWIKRRNGSGGSVNNINGIGGMNNINGMPNVPSLNAIPSMHSILPSEGSEEDPFADIPDLSVDATMELHNLKPAVASPMKPSTTGPVLFTNTNAAPLPPPVPSHTATAPVPVSAPSETDNDTVVEHEISIDEGRRAHSTLHSSSPTRSSKRHLAISFSSPIASIIQDFVVEDDSESRMDRSPDVSQDAATSSMRRGRRTVSVKFKSTSTKNAAGSNNTNNKGDSGDTVRSRSRSASRGPARKLSVAGHAFVPRPVSRIDEREEDDTNHSRGSVTPRNRELSLIGDRSELVHEGEEEGNNHDFSELVSRQASVSVVVTTPGPAPRADDEQIMAQYVGMLSLSPMSEFTIHQERSLALEASYVLGDRHLVTGDASKAVMAQSLRDLVNRLTEEEPFEPYWEDMEELDVKGNGSGGKGQKGLESLHKLDEFCPALVSLDAAGNALRNLSGVPLTVRHLSVVDNQLSELTSWTRLANLQYLDISNNPDIKTLSGLKGLVHLRGLRADNCGLENLDGIKYHDALQTLRARNNSVAEINFDGTRLHKLVELDLEDNEIETATGLDQLVSLSTLNLRRNKLVEFSPDVYKALPHVRTLNVSDNQLAALDVRGLPSLRVLFADRNRLARVRGFSKTPRLDSVSLREQVLDSSESLDISSLYHAYEIRKLYLSGNRLDSFDPPVDFLNLQLLELANCGLTSLPPSLANAVPNLRKVNLNFNALSDLGPLAGISRLKKVLAAGNRLSKAFAVIQTLATFVHLTEVDLRDNPVTQGFYPHVTASTVVAKKGGEDETKDTATPLEPFMLPPADADQDKAYCSRLDLATGMRRRVYSQVLGDACATLKVLDGLPVDRELGQLRDAVWEALNDKGIVVGEAGEKTTASDAKTKTGGSKSKNGKKDAKNVKKEGKSKDDSRWGAEDSFA